MAKRAGVSVSTVSYALSGARPISDATRQRVEAAMAELDYTPNAFARALKSRRSRILAFLVPVDVTATDAYMVEMLFAAAERARSDGYHLLLWTESEDESLGVRDLASDGLIDGALVVSVVMDDARVEALVAANVPFVTIGRTRNCDEHVFVDTDDHQTVALVMEQLTTHGHTRVEFVGPPVADFERGVGIVVRLEESLRAAAAAAGVEIRSSPCEFSASAGFELVRGRAAQPDPPTAYVVMNPPALDGVMAGLEAIGRDVPGDVSVIGLLATGAPGVTSVAADASVLGATASEVMVDALEGRSVDSQRLIACHVVAGRTLGPAPA